MSAPATTFPVVVGARPSLVPVLFPALVHGLMVAEMVLTMWPGAARSTVIVGALALLALAAVLASASATTAAQNRTRTRLRLHWRRTAAVDLATMAAVQLSMVSATAMLGESRTVSLVGLVLAAGWPAARCAADPDRRHQKSALVTGVGLLAMIACC